VLLNTLVSRKGHVFWSLEHFQQQGKKVHWGKPFPGSWAGRQTMLKQQDSAFRWPALHQPGDQRETPRTKGSEMRQWLAEGAFISALLKANQNFTCHNISFGP